MFPAKYFYRGYDKQFGADGTSLFILRVCFLANVEVLYAVCKQTALKKYFSETDSLSALADTMKNFFTEQSYKALMFPAKYFYRGRDEKIDIDNITICNFLIFE